jgi:ubiquinone/menaquinone biosynthesis C-methylase UbiE
MTTPSAITRFREEYGAHRASEGRAHSVTELHALPYLRSGPLAKQWSVRARTFDAFMSRVVRPVARTLDRPLRLLDLGAGNAWLSWRVALEGGECVAVDIRDDRVDGLGAASTYVAARRFERVVASFDALPLSAGYFDVVVFNASVHYAVDLDVVLREARRVARGGGRIVILDSPFYGRDADGAAMVDEKRRQASQRFGARADALTALPFIEYLTAQRLASASNGAQWQRHRVTYPLWYELRPLVARLRGRRRPSRFDLWECAAS